MFEKITIHLAGPICICPKEDLSWRLEFNSMNSDLDLILKCRTCSTELRVPYNKLLAVFDLRVGYLDGTRNKADDNAVTKKEPVGSPGTDTQKGTATDSHTEHNKEVTVNDIRFLRNLRIKAD